MPTRRYAPLDSTGMLPTEVIPASQGAPAPPHPDLAEHDALGLATDAALTTHAATAHGTQAHAISGVQHTGTLDHSALSNQTANQHHSQAHSISGVDHSGTLAIAQIPTGQTGTTVPLGNDARFSDARTPLPHAHVDADIPAAIARDSEVTAAIATHAATPHGGAGTWTTVIKTADESKNNLATVADDLLLKFTTAANTNYVVRLKAWWLTNATADAKYRLVHTGTTTRVRRAIVATTTADMPAEIATKTAFDAADVILSTTGLNPYLAEDVILQVGASGGVFKLQWSQVTSNAGPTTCLEGSYLEYAVT